MRVGAFPGQLEELKRLARLGLEAERRSRRQLVASAVGLVLVGVGGFWLGRRSVATAATGADESAPSAPIDRTEFLRSRLPLARRLAAGSDAELLTSHATFLSILGVAAADDGVWRGFERLATIAESNRDRDLARALLQAAAIADVPASSRARLDGLRSLVR